MNVQQTINALANANQALQHPERYSAAQLTIFRRTRRAYTKTVKIMEANLQTVKFLVSQEFNIKQVPLDETFGTLGASMGQLNALRNALTPTFNKSCVVLFSDTVYSLTDKLQGQ